MSSATEQNLSKGSGESDKLVISVFLPLTGDSGWDGTAYIPGGEIARELVNNKTDLLPSYELVLEYSDSSVSDYQFPL